ncbi:sigma-70 family RNA polymerase sigma factor [Sphingomonas sp.]|uniref:sigma-70 family RNA polymerase sigma factor n=1 Tax=Sphingomonas sp. TaxID=28214 RepID=UPI003B00B448
MPTSEDQLRTWMAGGLDGDAASHAALLRSLVPLLRGFYRRRLGDGAELEDLVQETLIAVHTRRASYDRDRPFTAWLFSIARYKMIDHLRRTRRHYAVEDSGEVPSVESFEEASNASIDVERLLDGLPHKQAAAIRRTRLNGFSTFEAAEAAGIGESDVKVSVHRGLKTLAARIMGERR